MSTNFDSRLEPEHYETIRKELIVFTVDIAIEATEGWMPRHEFNSNVKRALMASVFGGEQVLVNSVEWIDVQRREHAAVLLVKEDGSVEEFRSDGKPHRY